MTYLLLDHDTVDRLLVILAHNYALAQHGAHCVGCNGPHDSESDECDVRMLVYLLHELHDDAFGAHDTFASPRSAPEKGLVGGE